ncbi:MAG: hypothetical protein P4L28_01530 [Paludibacteraceae bacterium]|nr:hypothetical protein [Paludibacteraceae bacterium]
MKKIYTILCALLCFVSLTAYSQVVTVQARLDSSSMLIGEQTKLHLEVTQEKKVKVSFPVIADSLIKGLEVVKITKLDTTELEGGRIKVSADVLLTSFDSATYYIPPFKFIAGTDTIETNPLSLKVLSVKVDTVKQRIYDIKPVYNAKINWAEVLETSLIILLILALLAVAFWYIRKRLKAKNQKEEEAIIVNPHEFALKELDRIKSEKVWQQGRIKEFYTDVTSVLRLYIQHRFKIPTLEMTSDEIIDNMEGIKEVDKEAKMQLKQILRLSDLVKFAKWTPDLNENDLTISNAYLFVNETKEEIVEPVDTEEKESDAESSIEKD